MTESIMIPLIIFFVIIAAAGLSFMLWFMVSFIIFLFHESQN